MSFLSPNNNYLTVSEARKLVGCSHTTILNWINQSKFTFLKKKVGLRFIYLLEKRSFLIFWNSKKSYIEENLYVS